MLNSNNNSNNGGANLNSNNNSNNGGANPYRVIPTVNSQNPNHPSYVSDGTGFGWNLNGNENLRNVITSGEVRDLLPNTYSKKDKENFNPSR